MDLNTSTEFQPDQWQQQHQQFHHAFLHPTDCSDADRTHQTIQNFWTWLDQEVGPNPAGRATIVGQFLNLRDCRALGQLIDPTPELWNTPKLDLIDNSYDNYMDYGWRYTTLNELHAQHEARCASQPINPYIIQNKTHPTPDLHRLLLVPITNFANPLSHRSTLAPISRTRPITPH